MVPRRWYRRLTSAIRYRILVYENAALTDKWYLRVKCAELQSEARAVFLDVEEDVEDAQALIFPRVRHLLDPALMQERVHGRGTEDLFDLNVLWVEEWVRRALNVKEVWNFLGLEEWG